MRNKLICVNQLVSSACTRVQLIKAYLIMINIDIDSTLVDECIVDPKCTRKAGPWGAVFECTPNSLSLSDTPAYQIFAAAFAESSATAVLEATPLLTSQ
jgi:hypothetical protein